MGNDFGTRFFPAAEEWGVRMVRPWAGKLVKPINIDFFPCPRTSTTSFVCLRFSHFGDVKYLILMGGRDQESYLFFFFFFFLRSFLVTHGMPSVAPPAMMGEGRWKWNTKYRE